MSCGAVYSEINDLRDELEQTEDPGRKLEIANELLLRAAQIEAMHPESEYAAKDVASLRTTVWELKTSITGLPSPAQQRAARSWQMPMPFEEYYEVVEQQKGMLNTYDGHNISGKPSAGHSGIFEHFHAHKKTDSEGIVHYYRDKTGAIYKKDK